MSVSKTIKLNDSDENKNKINIVKKTRNFTPLLSSKWYNDVKINDLPLDILEEESSSIL